MTPTLAPQGIDPAQVWRDRYAELVSPAYSRYSDLVVERARGAHLYTLDGRDVIDFGSGIGVTNLGHNHPDVVRAVHEQVDRLWHTSVTTLHTRMIELADHLSAVAPPGLDQVFLANSGAEAVEGALKLARRATGRTEVIAFHGAFHGRTYGAVSLTASKAKYRSHIGAMLPGVHHVPYPYCFRDCTHTAGERCRIAMGEHIEELFTTRVAPDTVAAIFVEPVLGEGGYVVPPAEFLPRLRQICDTNGILLVADEIQSGMARTGRMFAVEHWNVVPDIMLVAKALGNGLPIAAIVARHAVMGAWHAGEHGSTFGGNPVACAAALAVLEVMQRDRIAERAERLGSVVMERMRALQSRVPALADVRGLGLMIGLEFLNLDTGMPATEMIPAIRDAGLRRDLLLLSCGVDDNVIRLVPSLTIEEDELDHALGLLEESILEAQV